MLLCSHQIKRAARCANTETALTKIERISFDMAEKSITQFSFLEQVAALAPTVFNLINSKHARITAAVTSHDAVNGYGRGFTFYLKLELYLEQCQLCGETQFSRPVLECYGHRVERRYMQIADAEGRTLERALVKLEMALDKGNQQKERMAA